MGERAAGSHTVARRVEQVRCWLQPALGSQDHVLGPPLRKGARGPHDVTEPRQGQPQQERKPVLHKEWALEPWKAGCSNCLE